MALYWSICQVIFVINFDVETSDVVGNTSHPYVETDFRQWYMIIGIMFLTYVFFFIIWSIICPMWIIWMKSKKESSEPNIIPRIIKENYELDPDRLKEKILNRDAQIKKRQEKVAKREKVAFEKPK